MVQKSRWKKGLTVLAVLGVATLSACGGGSGSDSSSGSDDPFQVLAIYPTSGPLAPQGKAASEGVQAAVDILNDRGGIDGREIELTIVDDASDASKAVLALQDYLASNEKPDLLIPGMTSQEILAVLPLATQNKIFTTTTAATAEVNDPEKYPYAFHVLAEAKQIATIGVEHLADQGYQSIGFLGPDSASGSAGLEAFKAAAEDAGLDFHGELMDPTATDAAPTLLRLQSEDPDVLVFDGVGPTGGVFLAGRTKLGWDVPVLGTANFSANNLGVAAKPADLVGVELLAWDYTVEGSETQSSDKFTAYREALTAYVDGDLPVGHAAYGFGYNMVIVAAAAYEGSDSDEVEDLKKVLESGDQSQEIADLSLGPVDWGYTDKDHFQQFTAADIAIVKAGPTQNGSLVPGS